MMKAKLIIYMLLLCVAARGQVRGRVVGVSDGDTFTLLDSAMHQVKVRVHGVDCPEKKQAYGQRAKLFAGDMLHNRMVLLQVTDTDRYGRVVAIVVLGDGRVYNELLLLHGLAWHYKRYDNNPVWAAYESSARAAKRGLWADSNAVAPWVYRKSKK